MGSETEVLFMARYLLNVKGGYCVARGLSSHNATGSLYCPGDGLSIWLEYKTGGAGVLLKTLSEVG